MPLTKVNGQMLDGAITADSSGNVGIGTSSPAAKLDVRSGTSPNAANILVGLSGSNNYYDANTHIWQSGSSIERMRIDSSGNLCLGINGQMNSGKQSIEFNGFTHNGITIRTTYASTGSNYLAFYNSANQVTGFINQNGTTTVAYTTSSDYRLKENIEPMRGALNKVAQLKPVIYTWKTDGSASQGFIAHELQAVVPECVTGEKDAVNEDGSIKPQGVDTSFLVATLTAAIQELKAELDATKAEVAELKARGQ